MERRKYLDAVINRGRTIFNRAAEAPELDHFWGGNGSIACLSLSIDLVGVRFGKLRFGCRRGNCN
jgi:hypothetical protein